MKLAAHFSLRESLPKMELPASFVWGNQVQTDAVETFKAMLLDFLRA